MFGVFAAGFLAIALLLFVFWPQRGLAPTERKTRLDYLVERREVIYENLRDLTFEYRAGKHPELDFERQRGELEGEAAAILSETDLLESLRGRGHGDEAAARKR